LNTESQIDGFRLSKAKAESEHAQYETHLVMMQFRPCYQVPCTIKRDGSRWICTLESSPNVLECVTAYGESPAQAMENFDAVWLGTGYVLPEPKEEDDDYVEEF